MTQNGNQNRTIPLDVSRGMWGGGDSAMMPSGYARSLRNVQRRSRVTQARPQLTYDGLQSVRALASWYDNATGKRRLFACADPAAFYVKDAVGEGWSSSLGIASGALDILDSVSYRGVLYILTGSAAHVPLGVYSYDGAALSSVPYTSTFSAFRPRVVEAFKERLFYAAAKIVINNSFHQTFGADYEYDAGSWSLTNVVASTFMSGGGATISRITPTDVTTAHASALAVNAGSLNDDTLTWAGALRGTHATYRMPMTAQLKFSRAWSVADVVAAGNVAVPVAANGYRYRVTVAGTTDATTEPVWPTTVGTTVVDGTVTWICDGTDVAAQAEMSVPTAGESDFLAFSVRTLVTSGSNTTVTPVLKFGTAAVPTYQLAAVDFSLRDGKTDGVPLKRNYGHQLTYGRMGLPFVNLDAGTGTIAPDQDDVIYSTEVAQGDYLRGDRYYRVSEVPGPVTALRATMERLVAFKRSARWVFAAVDNPSLPILPEGDVRLGAGALNSKAVGVGPEGSLYYVGDDECYRWNLKDDPEPLCTDAMRDEIMNKSVASWVESQPAPANRALLAVDQRNREVWVYTQKGKLYCYHIDDKAWSVHDAGGGDSLSPVGYEICDMAYNPTTGNMYFAFTTAAAGTAGVARLDPTVTPAEDSISTSGTLPVIAEIWPRPVEASTPSVDVQVDTLRFYHKVTGDQAGQTTRGDISFDQGVSFTRSLNFDLAPLSPGGFVPLEFPIFQSWNTVQARLVHTGKGGASNFAVSRIEADLLVLRGYYPKSAVTCGASTL